MCVVLYLILYSSSTRSLRRNPHGGTNPMLDVSGPKDGKADEGSDTGIINIGFTIIHYIMMHLCFRISQYFFLSRLSFQYQSPPSMGTEKVASYKDPSTSSPSLSPSPVITTSPTWREVGTGTTIMLDKQMNLSCYPHSILPPPLCMQVVSSEMKLSGDRGRETSQGDYTAWLWSVNHLL